MCLHAFCGVFSDFATQLDASACHDLAGQPNSGMGYGRYGNCNAGEGRARGAQFTNAIARVDALRLCWHSLRILTILCAEIQDTEFLDFYEDAARVHRHGGKDACHCHCVILLTHVMQLAGWAVMAPVAALVAYCSVHMARAVVSVFKRKPQ